LELLDIDAILICRKLRQLLFAPPVRTLSAREPSLAANARAGTGAARRTTCGSLY
jgi:hypothetical protein